MSRLAAFWAFVMGLLVCLGLIAILFGVPEPAPRAAVAAGIACFLAILARMAQASFHRAVDKARGDSGRDRPASPTTALTAAEGRDHKRARARGVGMRALVATALGIAVVVTTALFGSDMWARIAPGREVAPGLDLRPLAQRAADGVLQYEDFVGRLDDEIFTGNVRYLGETTITVEARAGEWDSMSSEDREGAGVMLKDHWASIVGSRRALVKIVDEQEELLWSR